jgi:hypothetical protein
MAFLEPTELSRLNKKNSNNIVSSIVNTQWDFSDDFKATITINPKYVQDFNLSEEVIEKSIVSIEIPTLSSQEIDNIVAGTRRVNVRMQELFRFNIRFRDFNNGILRRIFSILFAAQQFEYFNDIAIGIKIEYNNPKKDIIFQSEKCLITQISPITYNNDGNIVEFDVNFVSPSFTNTNLVNFGSDSNYNKSFDSNSISSENIIKYKIEN